MPLLPFFLILAALRGKATALRAKSNELCVTFSHHTPGVKVDITQSFTNIWFLSDWRCSPHVTKGGFANALIQVGRSSLHLLQLPTMENLHFLRCRK